MNKLLSLKSRLAALASLLLVCLMASAVQAGQWELEGYFWSGSSASKELVWSQDYYTAGKYETHIRRDYESARNQSSNSSSSSNRIPSGVRVSTIGQSQGGQFVTKKGIVEDEGEVAATVYARFNWRRNMKVVSDPAAGGFSQVPDPDDNPPSHIYVRESGSMSAGTNIRQIHGNPTLYTLDRLWKGDFYTVTGSGMGLELSSRIRSYYDPANSWQYGPNYKTLIRKVAVSGDSVVVPSQSFSGEIKVSPGYEKEYPDQHTSAYLGFGYQADTLNFSLNASGFAVATRKQVKSDTESIDALIGLRWLSPDNLETGASGDKIVPSRDQVRGFLKNAFGSEQIDDGAPLPYFAGQATFSVNATRSDGHTPIFDSQIYKWTPDDNTDPFDPDKNGTPGFVASSPSERTYVWNFGSAQEGADNFPKTSTVTVEVTSENEDAENTPMLATKKINWYTTWSPTETGLQKNVVTSQLEKLTLPDGSPIDSWLVKPGDTILCFVEGDPGFSTDSSHVEKIRPVPFGQQNSPGPGERVEPRVIGSVTPTGNGDKILIFDSTPKVNPDDDPNAPGFDDIQAARAVAAANQQAYQTGKSLTKTALELQMEIYKAMAFAPAEGLAIEQAIKGIVALHKFEQASKALKAITPALEEGAEATRLASKALRTAGHDASIGAKNASKMEKVAVDVERQGARSSQLAKDSKGITTNGETYNPRALEKLKEGGCFVAGTLVWISDGTTRPIEQVKVGDTVLSKNEQTGEIAAKKVTNVSVRADIWTRKLSFDNGAILETTDEHPLYVDGRGFVKAKEVGIGSSIVTRAGPSAKVVSVQADVRQATVYNFTVDEFHTYFVGDAALWVHNNGSCEIEKVMGRPFREVNPEFPPDSSALNKFANTEQRPGYCDDFSNVLYDASNSSDKRLLRIVNEGGRKDVFNLENGSLGNYAYHDVFSDGRYVYDKLLSPNPIPKGDWEQYMAKLNPGSTILVRPRNAPWDFGFTPR